MAKTAFTGYTVEVRNLESTMRWLAQADPKLKKALQRGLKEAMSPVLQKARANGHRIQDDGTYASSLSIASRAGGTQYVLKSTDVAAGVKEFAKPGATRLVGKSARSSTQRARKYAGQPLGPGLRAVRVGVPHRASPPRVMVQAVKDSEHETMARIEARLADVLNEVGNG